MPQASGYINGMLTISQYNIVDDENTMMFSQMWRKKKIHKLCGKQKGYILTIK